MLLLVAATASQRLVLPPPHPPHHAPPPPQVHFELTGSRGSSGVLHPVGTPKSFGSGRMDVFEVCGLAAAGCEWVSKWRP